MKLKKAFRDLKINPKRTSLAVFALILGIWGLGTVYVSYFILNSDLDANYQSTYPAQLVLYSDNFDVLDVQEFINRPEIETAEFRDYSLQRIEVFPDVWIPVLLYGVENFEDSRLSRIFLEEGNIAPNEGTILIERNCKLISDIDIGSTPRLRIGNKITHVPVSGICFDPGQAPATQEHRIYAYADEKTYSQIVGKENNHRLIVRLNNVQSKKDVERLSEALVKDFIANGMVISSVDIPKFNEHPHQWQLNTLLFLIGAIGILAFLMGAVLVSQLMRSILANQVRQIGIQKATGATRCHVFQIYIAMLLLLGLGAGIIAVPLSVAAGNAFSGFVASILNFNIFTTVTPQVYIILFITSLLLPVLLSISLLLKGTGISVQEALSDYGISDNSGGREYNLLRKLKLPNAMTMAFRNSLRNSRRLTVTIVAMALGVAIFSTGFNVRQSLWELLSGLKNELRYDVQVVLSNQISREEVLQPFESLKNVKAIGMWNGGSGAIQSKILSTVKGAGVVALPYNTELLKPKIIDGRWLDSSNEIEVVLNQQAWNLYNNLAIGSKLKLRIGDKEMTTKLVGVIEQFDEAKLYMDVEQYDATFNPDHLINSLMFVATNNEYEKVIELKKDIESLIIPSNLNVLNVISQAERVKVIYDHLNIILTTIVMLSFLVLLVSAVGMASATGINIWERTREIGVMRAIGATPKKIYSMFVNEGIIISVLSILIGLLLAYPLSKIAAVFFGDLMLGEEAILQYAFSPAGFWITLVVTLLFGWLASRIPANSAIQIPTHEALSYE